MYSIRRYACMATAAAVLCFTSSAEAAAQRTMRGEGLLTVGPHMSAVPSGGIGGSVSYGQYLLSSFWNAGVECAWTSPELDGTGTPVECIRIRACGDYMQRIVGTRSRRLSLYGGAGVFLGYEIHDPAGLLPEESLEDIGEGAFIYGIRAGLEAEIFFSRRVALVLRGRVPVTFSSPLGWLGVQYGAGIRIDI